MSQIKTTELEGDVAIGRHVTTGGNATIQGNGIVKKNLKVEGWLEAKNIKSSNKGVFISEAALREAYPHPHEGWFAGVVATDEDMADLDFTVEEGKDVILLYVESGGDWVCAEKLFEVYVDLAEVKDLRDQLEQVSEDVKQANDDITEMHNNKGKPYGFVPLDENGLIAPKFIPEALIYEVTLRPEFSGEAPEALREAVQKHFTGQSYALRVKVSDSVTIDPDRPIIPSVPVVSGDTVSKGGDTLPDGGASVVDEDGVSSQADNDGEGRSLSLGITFEVLSTKEVAGTGDGESGIMYELLSVERFRGTVRMYFCTMTVYYNEDLSEVSVSLSPVASEAIFEKQEKLKDSEDITVEGDKLSLTESAKYESLVKEFIAAGGGFNKESQLGSLNGITDLTYDDMAVILNAGILTSSNAESFYAQNTRLRTNLRPVYGWNRCVLTHTLWGCSSIEVFNAYRCGLGYAAFSGCKNLHTILNILYNDGASTNAAFSNCVKLKSLQLKIIAKGVSFSLSDSPLVDLQSFRYMVTNAENTSAITITVHPDVYAKLTGDETNAAYTSLTDEEKAQWTALVPLAIEKNIAFATV